MSELRSRVGEVRFVVSAHAVLRYAQRASQFPDDVGRGRRQLGQVIRSAGTLGARPAWVNDRPEGEEDAQHWLLLGEDVAMPLVSSCGELVAVTCLARGSMSAAARARRRDHKKRVRRGKRNVRELRSWKGESGPRWR